MPAGDEDRDKNLLFKEGCYTCPDCEQPLVLLEQELYRADAPRRFYAVCPECQRGMHIVALRVRESVEIQFEDGACVFNTRPHNHRDGDQGHDQDEMDRDFLDTFGNPGETEDDVIERWKREEIERAEKIHKKRRKRRK